MIFSRAFLRNTSLAVTSPHSPQRVTCYPSAVFQPRAAILFRCYSNGSRAFLLSIYLSVTSRQIFRACFSLWRHIFPAIHPMFRRNQRRYHVKNNRVTKQAMSKPQTWLILWCNENGTYLVRGVLGVCRGQVHYWDGSSGSGICGRALDRDGSV
jgi:hypothetical protein